MRETVFLKRKFSYKGGCSTWAQISSKSPSYWLPPQKSFFSFFESKQWMRCVCLRKVSQVAGEEKLRSVAEAPSFERLGSDVFFISRHFSNLIIEEQKYKKLIMRDWKDGCCSMTASCDALQSLVCSHLTQRSSMSNPLKMKWHPSKKLFKWISYLTNNPSLSIAAH